MEDTNPQGSAKTVDDAAAQIFGMLEPEQPEGQAEAQAEEVTEEYEAQAEESEDEPSEEVQEEVQEPQRFRVKVDNEELEVDLDELIKGYSRTSDYTKKTQNLAEQRKAVESERTKIEEAAKLRDTYAQRLQVIEQMLTQPTEDLTALKDNARGVRNQGGREYGTRKATRRCPRRTRIRPSQAGRRESRATESPYRTGSRASTFCHP